MIGPSGCFFQEIFLSFKINVHVTFLKRYRIRLLIFMLKCQYIQIAQIIIKGSDKLTIKTVSIYIGTVNENGARMYTITHAQLNSTKIATTNIIRSSREGTFAYAFTSPQTRLHSHSFLREGVRVIFKSFKNQTRIFRCVCTFTN